MLQACGTEMDGILMPARRDPRGLDGGWGDVSTGTQEANRPRFGIFNHPRGVARKV